MAKGERSMNLTVKPAKQFSGSVVVPGDKSMTHRALLLSSMASGPSEIQGALMEGDCKSTVTCLQRLGIQITSPGQGCYQVEGKGLFGFREPAQVLYTGNSGTTMRLLLGVLAGQPFTTVINGDRSLRRRPMGRVTGPLQDMGADIIGRENNQKAPLAVRGRKLTALDHYRIPVPSAQVKSSLLLAGLYTDGVQSIIESIPTRDHTEIMLASCGVHLEKKAGVLSLPGGQEIRPRTWMIPGDFSSAAFLIGAALLFPGSQLKIKQVGLNPTRTGFLDILKAMGAAIEVTDQQVWNGETVGTVKVTGGPLHGVKVSGEIIPRMIDEIPILTVLAANAVGETEISGAGELRFKESDRITCMVRELTKMGADLEEKADGLLIRGGAPLSGGRLHSYGDHRIAMSLLVAALAAENESTIHNAECVSISYPDFVNTVSSLAVREE